jgi:hypothetical protein
MVTATRFTTADIGCYFDGARGIYIGEAIQEMAQAHGWSFVGWVGPEFGHYHEATAEAEDYLNTLTADDVSFGSNESGDWGLWHLCEDDTDCEFCANL